MRTILFRGKRIDNGQWIVGNYIRKNKSQCVDPTFWCALIQDMALSAYEVIPETVGQFTGLTDKNGTMIFEDDIILFKQNEKDPGVHLHVVYDCKLAGFYGANLSNPQYPNSRHPLYQNWIDDGVKENGIFLDLKYAVFGNIHSPKF